MAEILVRDEKSHLDHSERLYEAETAREMGIPFDHQWYSIEVEAREYLIASKLGRTFITNQMSK